MEEKPEEKSVLNDPEIIKKLIEVAPPLLKQTIEALERSGYASTEAAKVIHGRVFRLAMAIILTGAAASLIAIYQGNATVAEKIIIPLISFAGGLGLGSKLK